LAQEPWKTYEVDPVTVTATRLGQKFIAMRSVTVLDYEDINKLPSQSLAQLLNYALGVSMNSRGTPGVQSDPSLRGAGFEQVLFLLDGVRMNDPQTGHHNVNLPIAIRDIERIEVLRGHSSTLYGPDAFGGVVNIITRSASENLFSFELKGGSFETAMTSGTFSTALDKFNSRMSFETSRSDGYLPEFSPHVDSTNTDYRIHALHWKNSYTGDKLRLTFSTGILEKKFGAFNFYVNNGKEYERIQSFYSGFKSTYIHSNAFTSILNIHYKQHRDHYELSRFNPSIYTADHITERYTGEVTGRFSSERFGNMTAGIEAIREGTVSNRLKKRDSMEGNFYNVRFAVFGEYGNTITENLPVSAGIRIDSHSEWGTEVNPSFSLGYFASKNLFLKSSIGRSFRGPTFIELYSPAVSGNTGSPSLKPEKAISFDIGAEYILHSGISGSTTYYRRRQESTIDWVSTDGITFKALNIFDIISQGFEQEFRIHFSDIYDFRLFYTYLHQNKKQKGIISKYVFIHPKHHLLISPSVYITSDLQFNAILTWKERARFNNYWVLDAKFTYLFRNLQFSLEGFNLTDEEYEEIRRIPMPGRAVYAGIGFSY